MVLDPTMRLHWRCFVCYSFVLLVFVCHLLFQFSLTPYPPYQVVLNLQDSSAGAGQETSAPNHRVRSDNSVSPRTAQNRTHHSPSTWSIADDKYIFNCTNIHDIPIKRTLGQGVTKQVFLGTYEGRKVAVKMVTRNAIDVVSCIKRAERDGYEKETEKHRCYSLANMKLMKEILLLEQLKHPNLLRMLGYCVRSEETESTSLQDHGVVAVYEYGLRFYISTLQSWPWKLRLKTAVELADLLYYLEHSPLGSLGIPDFKDAHFLLKDGRIKLTDLDDVSNVEPACSNPTSAASPAHTPCRYTLPCLGGICQGYNAKQNIKNFNELFFRNLLYADSLELSSAHKRALDDITSRLNTLSVSSSELRRALLNMMDIPYVPGYL